MKLKALPKWLQHLASPFVIGVIVTIAVTYASLAYYAGRGNLLGKDDHSLTSLIQEIHEKTIDWRLNDRGYVPGSDRVAILAIDEESLALEGYWPWSRDKMAELVDRTIMFGAKSISFDIVFSEESNNSAIPAIDRLKRAVNQKPELRAGMSELLSSEETRADADKVLAASIKAAANQLILGAFFRSEFTSAPYSELCLDARFDRMYQSHYWSKEALPLTVIDEPLNRLNYPKDLKDHLSQYFMSLEVTQAQNWFDKNQDVKDHVKEALDDLGQGLEPDTYPGLAVLAINNDFGNAKDLLSQMNPAFSNPDVIRTLFTRFLLALKKTELADLRNHVVNAGLDYCSRFWTDKDELLVKDKYTEIWGDSPDSLEQFKAFSWESFWNERNAKLPPDAPKENYQDAIKRIKDQASTSAIPQILDWVVNIPVLGESTTNSGYFNAIQDTDGSIRHSRLIARHGNSYAPSLALKTFLVDQGYNAILKIGMEDVGRKESTKIVKGLELGDPQGNTVLNVPIDHVGNIMINFTGPAYMFPYISAADMFSDSPMMVVKWRGFDSKGAPFRQVIERRVNKREFMKDKILIVGATAIGVYDMRVTPFDENYPGVETHANIVSNLLIENSRAKGESVDPRAAGFLRTDPREEKVMWIVLLAIGLGLSGLLTYFGSVAGLGITAVALTAVYTFDKYYLFKHGIVVTILFPTTLIFLTFVALTFYKYFTEERNKRALKGTFEKYVSPAIVAEVLADPSNIELGGKKMELTVMFSDVRGFTTISEKLDPRALSDLLNSYLTPMTNLVFEHKGTLDKYMGDAIMSFWGAPIHFPDHAKHACRCALHMIVKLKELQAEYRAQGLPEIDIGIGLNTGDMSVGNMGSDTVRSYTVMGDAVNLGSRLEGINKQYGTRIIISEFTQNEIKDSFITREVDWVRVKGKAQPVRIYELVAEGSVPAPIGELLKSFNEGFALYHEKKFTEAIEAFNRALAAVPGDPVAELYVERCQDYLKEPPPEDWDGVFTMTSK